jgi:site-specific recombinase XerD
MGNFADLKHQIELVRKLHEQDLQAGAGRVWLPYALAVQWPQAGKDIRTIQQLLGHSDVLTTMIYTHVSRNAASPLVRLQ